MGLCHPQERVGFGQGKLRDEGSAFSRGGPAAQVNGKDLLNAEPARMASGADRTQADGNAIFVKGLLDG